MPAGIGDNSKMLTPAEEQALFMHHYGLVAAARAKVVAARKEEQRLRKLAKADQIVLRDLDFAMRCAEIEDESIIVRQIMQEQKIARWFALPIGEAPEMDFGREPAIDRAEREGFAAGMAAKPRQPPHDPNSEAGRAWLAAYDQAQAMARDNLKSAMEKRNAEERAAKAKMNGHDADTDDDEDNAQVGVAGEDEDDDQPPAA